MLKINQMQKVAAPEKIKGETVNSTNKDKKNVLSQFKNKKLEKMSKKKAGQDDSPEDKNSPEKVTREVDKTEKQTEPQKDLETLKIKVETSEQTFNEAA